jgi:hypothetical protein
LCCGPRQAEPRDPVPIHVGRMAPETNVQLVLDTFEPLRREHPTMRLVMAKHVAAMTVICFKVLRMPFSGWMDRNRSPSPSASAPVGRVP